MRIAQIAPLAERVPPVKYGGTERVIYCLTEELVKRGHKVTLFASGDSKTTATLYSVVPNYLRKNGRQDVYGLNLPSLLNVGLAYSMQGQFDIIHDHNPNLSLPVAHNVYVPVVTTWHGPFNPEIANFFAKLNRPFLVGISKSQTAGLADLNIAGTVYNGLDMRHYPFGKKPENYLLFVGRIDEEKGPHIAIDTAVKLKRKLILAGKVDYTFPHIARYFEKLIKPRLKKHKKLVKWIGEVGENKRNLLMGKAQCLLHPVTWPEPFGLNLIEAGACGCPVVAFNKGAIPEIVVNKKTGFVVANTQKMLDAIKKVDTIDRQECRRHVLQNFGAEKMAQGYEEIYKKILNKTRN